MSSRELSEWMAFYQLEPWGYRPDNWRTGLIASTILNVNRPKKTSKLFKPEDLMPKERELEHDPVGLAEKIKATFQHVKAIFDHKKKS